MRKMIQNTLFKLPLGLLGPNDGYKIGVVMNILREEENCFR